MPRRFTDQMEAAAIMQLRNALGQGLNDDAAIAFATASLGREHEQLVRRVWDDKFEPKVGAG